MFCRHCGRQLPDDSDFCPSCGTKTLKEEEPGEEALSSPIRADGETYASTVPVPSEQAATPVASPAVQIDADTSPHTSYQSLGYLTAIFGVLSFLYSMYKTLMDYGNLNLDYINWDYFIWSLSHDAMLQVAIVVPLLILAGFLGLGIAISKSRPRVARSLTWTALGWWFVTAWVAALLNLELKESVAIGSVVSGMLYGAAVLLFLLRTRRSRVKADARLERTTGKQ